MRLSDVSHADIQCWLTGFDLAPASVGKTHRVLSMLLTYAVKDGRLVVKSRRRRKSARVHDVEKRFLSHPQVRDWPTHVAMSPAPGPLPGLHRAPVGVR